MPAQLTVGMLQARMLWLQGRADTALQRALHTLELGVEAHPFSMSQTLSLAVIPILLWRGDDGRVRDFLRAIHDAGCRRFQIGLGPDANAYHYNHMHFDMGRGPYCR